MADILVTAYKQLTVIGEEIIAQGNIRDTFHDLYGWNCPMLSRVDLAQMAFELSQKLESLKGLDLKDDTEFSNYLKTIPTKIGVFRATNLPHLMNGNAVHAVPNFMALLQSIDLRIRSKFDWKTIDKKKLPPQLIQKLTDIQDRIDGLVPDMDKVKSNIDLITSATEASENLPTLMKDLEKAKNKLEKIQEDSIGFYSKIQENWKDSNTVLSILEDEKEKARKILERCDKSYQAVTTQGLASAFKTRAERLSTSMWYWVSFLCGALVVAGIIGHDRYEKISKTISENTEASGVIWIQLALSIISLGGPIWFAWIATKQIGERFRLSEDYAFKASVATTYEGYRTEAARIDPEMEKTLFGSAMTRFDEAPLRLVKKDSYGSPWHELISSKEFTNALKSLPDLSDKVVAVVNAVKENIPKKKAVTGKEKTE